MSKIICILILLSSFLFAEYVDINELKPEVKNSQIIDIAKSTIRYVEENETSLARYSKATERYTLQEFPNVYAYVDIDQNHQSLYIRISSFDIKYGTNEKLFAIYLTNGKTFIVEDAWFNRETKQFEPIVLDMLLKFREQLVGDSKKLKQEQERIVNYFHNNK